LKVDGKEESRPKTLEDTELESYDGTSPVLPTRPATELPSDCAGDALQIWDFLTYLGAHLIPDFKHTSWTAFESCLQADPRDIEASYLIHEAFVGFTRILFRQVVKRVKLLATPLKNRPINAHTWPALLRDYMIAMANDSQRTDPNLGADCIGHGARFPTEIYTRGCHWSPRQLA
jgi:hypothetical protein